MKHRRGNGHVVYASGPRRHILVSDFHLELRRPYGCLE